MVLPEQHPSFESQTRNSLETHPYSRDARRKSSFFSHAADKLKDLFRKDSHQDDESRPQVEHSDSREPIIRQASYCSDDATRGQDHAGEPGSYRLAEWHSVSQFFAATQEDGPSNYYETDLWIWWQHRFCRARGTHCPDSSCPEKPQMPITETSNNIDTAAFDRHPRRSCESNHWRDRCTNRRSLSEHASWRKKFRLRKRPSKKSRGKQRDFAADEPQFASQPTHYESTAYALPSSWKQSSQPAAQQHETAKASLRQVRSDPEQASGTSKNSSPIPIPRRIGCQSPDQLMSPPPGSLHPIQAEDDRHSISDLFLDSPGHLCHSRTASNTIFRMSPILSTPDSPALISTPTPSRLPFRSSAQDQDIPTSLISSSSPRTLRSHPIALRNTETNTHMLRLQDRPTPGFNTPTRLNTTQANTYARLSNGLTIDSMRASFDDMDKQADIFDPTGRLDTPPEISSLDDAFVDGAGIDGHVDTPTHRS